MEYSPTPSMTVHTLVQWHLSLSTDDATELSPIWGEYFLKMEI